ncbi:MAG: SprT-like domain-containing protein [Tepidisphaeraceae bacterium]
MSQNILHAAVKGDMALAIAGTRPATELMTEVPFVGFNPDGSGMSGHEGSIYQDLACHQRAETWFGKDLSVNLQSWAVRFIVEFNLDVCEVALRIDALPCSRFGHFRVGHNGFGLKGEIALNSRYLSNRPFWQVLGTLLHELLHAWQHAHGNPSRRDHHNDEFRRKAHECGLNIDKRGVTGYSANSRFKDLLRENGVAVPDGEYVPMGERLRGNSKLKKWSCGCTNVRCGVGDFRAQCLKCGKVFQAVN